MFCFHLILLYFQVSGLFSSNSGIYAAATAAAAESLQSCPTLSDPMDCSPPGSSIHGIFQARVLEWGAIAFSVGYMQGKENQGTHLMSFLRFPGTWRKATSLQQGESFMFDLHIVFRVSM